MTLLDRALEYASWGWRIFPLLPLDKRPFPGSHGFADATCDLDIIHRWWENTPDANIGLATGPGSGVIVVDLDVDEGEAKDGIAEWRAITAGKPAIQTCIAQTGRPGRHLFFLCDNPIVRNRVLSKSIDIRGDGGYVVLPGSIHPNGNEYKWIDHPENVAPAPLPDWLLPKGNLTGLINSIAPSRIEMDAIERCRRYVETLPAAISGQGGHSATLRVAAECFRFGLTESQAWELLSSFNQRCQPAWSERELRHKLREGKKLVDREGKFGKRLDEGNFQADWPITRLEPTAIVVEDPEPEAKPEKSNKLRDLCENGYGAVASLASWINATAYKPQPILAMANSLAFWGAVMGHRARTTSDLRTNLYCLGVGESGSGKDHSRKAIKKICDAAKVTAEVLGGEELASDSAIMSAVYKASVKGDNQRLNGILFQLDEIGHMLSIVNSKYAASHMQNIVPTFMRLFSSANTTVIGKEFANRERQDITEPCVCLYGTTVPDRLFGGLSKFDITNGFLGRMLVFISDDPDPAESEKPQADFPADVLEAIEHWKMVAREKAHGGNMADVVPATFPFTSDAQEEMNKFVARCAAEKAATRDGSGMDVLWARAPEHARKVALTVAGGLPGHKNTISWEICRWSVALIEHLTRNLIAAISENMADSDFERQTQKVLKAIGRSAIPRTKLTRKIQSIPPRLRNDILRDLLETGRIEIVEKMSADTSKRPIQYIRPKKETHDEAHTQNLSFIRSQPSIN